MLTKPQTRHDRKNEQQSEVDGAGDLVAACDEITQRLTLKYKRETQFCGHRESQRNEAGSQRASMGTNRRKAAKNVARREKITTAMTGISASSAQRWPKRGTINGTRITPSTKPLPSTMAKYASAGRMMVDMLKATLL